MPRAVSPGPVLLYRGRLSAWREISLRGVLQLGCAAGTSVPGEPAATRVAIG